MNTKKAQTFAIRFTVHHKPSSNMGKLRPCLGTVPILMIARCFGGDCEAIEQVCLVSPKKHYANVRFLFQCTINNAKF